MATDGEEQFELSQIIFQAIDKKLSDLSIHMPGKIVSYDSSKNLAIVQPAFKRKYKSEDFAIDLPNISNVPVIFPRMGDGHLVFPIKPGMEGQLIFQQRSIDKWLDSGGEVDPEDTRKFALSDCTFLIGLTSQVNPLERQGNPNNAEFRLGKGRLEISPEGKFKITNGTEELFDLVIQLQEKVIKMNEELVLATTNTTFGALQLNNFNKFSTLKTDIETIKGKTEKLREV